MKNNEPIDIILVTYNRVHFLKKTIEAISERTRYKHRLIVVDNNSTDGTRDYLNRQKKIGAIDQVLLLPINIGQSGGQNEGFALAKSEIIVTTQDDLIPPDLTPCWLERMLHLYEKHYPNYGSICMRIERTRRLDWDEKDDIIRNRKSMPSVFRMVRKSDLKDLHPFGQRKHWESHEFAKIMGEKKMKFGMAVSLYANHLGFMANNKGYVGDFKDYFTYSPERVKQGEDKPYPVIDPKTNIPIEIVHGVDRPEHEKRMKYWTIDTGIQDHKESVRPSKIKQREEIAKYCIDGQKNVELGCGEFKCSDKATTVDTYPYASVDILNDAQDLWMFEDASIDNIVSSHLLEHMPNTKDAITEWARILKVGGKLVFVIPDANVKPSTICEPAHKVALTQAVVGKLMTKVFNFKTERLELIPGLEHKGALIYVGIKQ